MKVSLTQLKPNPHRNIESYPVDEDKVRELIKSYENTGFWGGLVCRKVGEHYEIAFGHHRLEALRRMKFEQVEVNVKNLDDATMLRMMADKNSESRAFNASADQEIVKAVVLAHGRGQIDLGEHIGPKTKKSAMLLAPSFLTCAGSSNSKRIRQSRYTQKSVALFLGWTKKDSSKSDGIQPSERFAVAWHCLELIEDDRFNLTDEDFRGLSFEQSEAIARETVAAAKAWQTEQRMQEARKKVAEKEAERAEADGLFDEADKEKLKAVQAAAAMKEAEAIAIRDADNVKKVVKAGFKNGLGVNGAKAMAKSVKTDRFKPRIVKGKTVNDLLMDQSEMVRCMFNAGLKNARRHSRKCST